MTTNSFNDNDPGHAHGDTGDSGVIKPGDNYASPWDLWYRPEYGKQPSYMFHNGDEENTSPYNLKITALIGVAYYDGANDGVFNDWKTGNVINLSASLGGNYPNLYGGSTGQEVGNLVRNTNPLIVNANSSLRMESNKFHLPNGVDPKHNLTGNGFEFLNLTGPERDILYDYGKVFFYEVEVFDKFTNALVKTVLLHPEIKTLPTGPFPNSDWKKVEDLAGNHLQGYVPGWTNLDLYYYDAGLPTGTIWNGPSNSGHKCDSREVVFDVPYSLALHQSPIPGGPYKLTLDILQNNFWLWQNSSLYLNLHK